MIRENAVKIKVEDDEKIYRKYIHQYPAVSSYSSLFRSSKNQMFNYMEKMKQLASSSYLYKDND